MDRIEVLVRPARQADTPDVIELTRTIWDGEDYVPHAWASWLSDRHGKLLVAEHQGRVLGLSYLHRISREDWWMQGLRVHPDYQGHGIASRLTEATLEAWLDIGVGTVRLTTVNPRVRQMCQRMGFAELAEFSSFAHKELPAKPQDTPFQLLAQEEAKQAVTYALQSPSLQFSAGLINMDWKWAPPRPIYLRKIVKRGQAWWWRGRRGLLAHYIDEDDQGTPLPILQFLACQNQDMTQCLADYLHLAAALGHTQAGWMAPLHAQVLDALVQAGFERDWEETLYLYAKEHPGRN